MSYAQVDVKGGPSAREIQHAHLCNTLGSRAPKMEFRIGRPEQSLAFILERIEGDGAQKSPQETWILHGYVDDQGRKGMNCIIHYRSDTGTGSLTYVFP